MIELSISRVKIDQHHIGGFSLIPADEMSFEEMQKIPVGETQRCIIKEITDTRLRSNEQLNLYFSCCKLVSDNTDDINWNTKNKTDEQVRIVCKFYEYYIYYYNEKTGNQTLHIKTRSISFANLKHIEACGYFSDAFDVLAQKIGLTKDELISEAQSGMLKKY